VNEKHARARIEAAVQQVVASGAESGVQVAVIKNGRVIADVTAGTADRTAGADDPVARADDRVAGAADPVAGADDPSTGAAVSDGTLFYAASTAKGVASSVAHVLAERGDVGYDLRAADVWPEFAARGKGAVTLRHVLLHTAGVPGLPADTTVADLCDWQRMCALVADEEPCWEPGTL
jgi:CubicO group peptidase (beta-lactamase class C family)